MRQKYRSTDSMSKLTVNIFALFVAKPTLAFCPLEQSGCTKLSFTPVSVANCCTMVHQSLESKSDNSMYYCLIFDPPSGSCEVMTAFTECIKYYVPACVAVQLDC